MEQENNLQENTNNGIDKSRRKFATAGIAASGVLLTLASKSSLADTVCRSPSGFQSGNNSAFPAIMCGGKSPNTWNGTTAWPTPYTTSTLFYGGAFAITPYKKADYDGKTLKQVLDMYQNVSSQQHELAAYAIAALLNCAAGLMTRTSTKSSDVVTILTATQVINMYKATEEGLLYEVTAGVKWDATQILNYFKSTISF